MAAQLDPTTAQPASTVPVTPPAEPKPRKRWSDIASDPNFQALDSKEQEQVRGAYYDRVIAPNLDPAEAPTARAYFDEKTRPGKLSSTLHDAKHGLDRAADAVQPALHEGLTAAGNIARGGLDLAKSGIRAGASVVEEAVPSVRRGVAALTPPVRRLAPETTPGLRRAKDAITNRIISEGINNGLTPVAAAGIAGNFDHETGGFRYMQELKPTIPGSQGGYGWAQWTGPRRQEFLEYAQANGLSPSSPEANLGYTFKELQDGRHVPKDLLQRLNAADTVEEATRLFRAEFERPGVVADDSRAKRSRAALTAWQQQNKTAAADSPVDSSPGTRNTIPKELYGLPLKPGYIETVKAEYEAADPKRRAALLTAPGIAGRVAQFIHNGYQDADAVTGLNSTLAGLGGRREDREDFYAGQGWEQPVAKRLADEDLKQGRTAGRELLEQPPHRPPLNEQIADDWRRGVLNLKADAHSVAGWAHNVLGDEQKARSYLQDAHDLEQEAALYRQTIGDFSNIGEHELAQVPEEVGRYLVEGMVENLPTMLPTLVAGGITGAAARAIAGREVAKLTAKLGAANAAKFIAEKAAAGAKGFSKIGATADAIAARKAAGLAQQGVTQALGKQAAATTIGAGLGGWAASGGQETGSIYSDIHEQTGQLRPGLAAGVGIAAGALDALPTMLAARRVLGNPATEFIKGEVIKRLGTEGGKQFLAESIPEFVQTLMESGAVHHVEGQPYVNPQDVHNALNAFLKAGASGAGIGMATQSVAEARDAWNQPPARAARLGADLQTQLEAARERLPPVAAPRSDGTAATDQPLLETPHEQNRQGPVGTSGPDTGFDGGAGALPESAAERGSSGAIDAATIDTTGFGSRTGGDAGGLSEPASGPGRSAEPATGDLASVQDTAVNDVGAEAPPAVTWEHWDALHPGQREHLMAQSGWRGERGGANAFGKRVAQQPWTAVPDAVKTRLQGQPLANKAKDRQPASSVEARTGSVQSDLADLPKQYAPYAERIQSKVNPDHRHRDWSRTPDVLNGQQQPTGWKRVESDSGITIVNPKTGEQHTYTPEPGSGIDYARGRAVMAGLASELAAPHEPSAPGAMVVQPLFNEPNPAPSAPESSAATPTEKSSWPKKAKAKAKAAAASAADVKETTAAGQPAAAVPQWVEHTTAKGKTLRGIVRKDITVQEAKRIDPLTFRKEGGFFIREQYVHAPENQDLERPAGENRSASLPEIPAQEPEGAAVAQTSHAVEPALPPAVSAGGQREDSESPVMTAAVGDRAGTAALDPAPPAPKKRTVSSKAKAAENSRDAFSVARLRDGQVGTQTFRRGERVKLAGTYPMQAGAIEGISQANRQAKVNGVWHDFGWIYPEDYDERAAPRAQAEASLRALRERLEAGNSIEARDFLRAAEQHIQHFKLADLQPEVDALRWQAVQVERAHADRARPGAAGLRTANPAPETAKQPPPAIQMTLAEWRKIHKDFKGVGPDGTRSVLREGRLQPVDIVKRAPAAEPADFAQKKTAERAETQKEAPLPTVYDDPRMRRSTYRNALPAFKREITKGGDVAYITDEHGRVTGRTPSVNADWFKNIPDGQKMTVAEVHNAIDKAVAGKRLGVRQEWLIGYLLDQIHVERTAGNAIDYAKARRDEMRQARKLWNLDARDYGDLHAEPDYDTEAEAIARVIIDLTKQIRDQSSHSEEWIEDLLSSDRSDDEIVQILKENLHGLLRKASSSDLAPLERSSAHAESPGRAANGGDLFPAADTKTRTKASQLALNEAIKEQGRKSNATQTPPPDTGLLAQDNRQVDITEALGDKPSASTPAVTSPADRTEQQDKTGMAQSPSGQIAPKKRIVSRKAMGATERNTEDSGAELTANRRNRLNRGLRWEDIAEQTEALRVREVTKAKVYPKPDYAELAQTLPSVHNAYLVKQVYDSLAASPASPTGAPVTDADLKDYISAVNRVMADTLEWAKGAAWVSPYSAQSQGKTLYETLYPQGWKPAQREIALLGHNRYLRAIQPGSKERQRAEREVQHGWPQALESWQRQGYRVVETVAAELKHRLTSGNRYVLYLDGHWIKSFDTEAEGQAALAALRPWVLLGKKGLVSDHATRESAVEAARAAVRKGDQSGGIDAKGRSVEAAERAGPERRMPGEEVTSDQVRETFGFKGVNFGNWMKGDRHAAERQLHLNHAYDALLDLADLLGVPPKALSLNGMLGLAIGAQGHGGKNGAHFVAGVNEINLTRARGAGALAHEWAHGLDHYFATLGGLARAKEPFLTEHAGLPPDRFSADLRPAVLDKFNTIVSSMRQRPMTAAEYAARLETASEKSLTLLERWVRSFTRDNASLKDDAEVTGLLERILRGDVGEGLVALGRNTSVAPAIAELRDRLRRLGIQYPRDRFEGLHQAVQAWQFAQDRRAAAAEHTPQMTATDYYATAAELDKGKQKKYWSSPWELFARAFDAYVTDKLAARAQKNSYLAGIEAAPPLGAERQRLNAEFDELVQTLETRETDQGVALFSRSQDGEKPSAEQLRQEHEETKARYVNTPGWLKAPNGKPSNLNERQWVRVRTPRFKAWFGDWEISAGALPKVASTFAQAREHAKAFQGKPLKNLQTGMVAQVSRNNLDKMLNDKAVGKSETPAIHAAAVANLDSLLRRATLGWSKPDAEGDPNITAIHRFFAPAIIDGRALLAKMTVKETAQANKANPLYTVEAVAFDEIKNPAAQWVGEIANADGIDPRTIRSAGQIVSMAQAVHDFKPTSVSKVLDVNGEPLLVHHGTLRGGFTTFNDQEAAFFTESIDHAASYAGGSAPAEDWFGYDPDDSEIPGVAYSAFLNIRTPVEYDFSGRNWKGEVLDEDGDPTGEIDKTLNTNQLTQQAIDGGNDGAIFRNVVDPGQEEYVSDYVRQPETEYVVFNSSQIKSVANTGAYSATHPDIRYRRGSDTANAHDQFSQSKKMVRQTSADQSTAQALNRALARQFQDPSWSHAYVQRDLPDTLAEFAQAAEAAFGAPVVGVTATEPRFDQFNGVNAGGRNFINLNAPVGFVHVTGHELLHQLKRDRPDLYRWFHGQARAHYKNLPAYKAKLDQLIQPGEEPFTRAAAEEELLGDFTGDALADPVFLEKLAKADPSRFRQLLNAVIKWLKQVGDRLRGKGLGSSHYFTDIETLRDHLAQVLVAYGQGGAVAVGKVEGPKFHQAWHGSPHDHDRFSAGHIGTGEGAQAFGWGLYFTNAMDIAEWYRDKLSGKRVAHWELDGKKVRANTRLAAFLNHHTLDARDTVDRLEMALRDVHIVGLEPVKRHALELLQAGRLKPVSDKGRLYQVELAPKEDEYLDWHKPLSEQSDKVKAGLLDAGLIEASDLSDRRELSTPGQSLYERAEHFQRSEDHPYATNAEAASRALHAVGIRGIRYPAEGQTGGKTGDRFNYVIFDDKDVEITAKFSRRADLNNYPDEREPYAGEDTFSADDPDHVAEVAQQELSAVDAAVSTGGGWKGALARLNGSGEESFRKLSAKARREVLGALTVHQLVDVGESVLPRMREYLSEMDRMDATRNRLIHESDALAQRWGKLPKAESARVGYVMHESTLAGVDGAMGDYQPSIDVAAARERIKALQRLQLGAGGSSKISQWQEEWRDLKAQVAFEQKREREWTRVQALYDALTPEGQAVYRAVRDYHAAHLNRVEQALIEMIEKTRMTGKQKYAAIQELKKEFETMRVQAPYFPLGRFGDYWVNVAEEINDAGKVVKEREFEKFETYEAAEAFYNQKQAEGRQVSRGKQIENLREVSGVSTAFVAQVEDLIGELGADVPEVADLRDQVYQLYLRTLPEVSARKHAIHRGKVAGYAQDALRTFANKAFHDAYAFARIQHGFELRENMEQLKQDLDAAGSADKARAMQDRRALLEGFRDAVLTPGLKFREVKERAMNLDIQAVEMQAKAKNRRLTEGERFLIDEAARWEQYAAWFGEWHKKRKPKATEIKRMTAEQVDRELTALDTRERTIKAVQDHPRGSEFGYDLYNELQRAYQWLMNPVTSRWASVLNAVGFGAHLAVSPAAWITNATQTPLIALPFMAARHGLVKTGKALNTAMGEALQSAWRWNTGKEHRFGIREALTREDDIRAYDAALDRGLIDRGRVMDLIGLAEEGAERSGLGRKFATVMGLGFQEAERLNRETTFMAAYRMERDSGKPFGEAVEYAGEVVNKTHFNYTSENRARFMRPDVARVLLQFKSYAQHVTFLQWQMVTRALGDAPTPEAKREARRFLALQTGLQLAAGGAMGLPLGVWAPLGAAAPGLYAAKRWGYKGALVYTLALMAAAVGLGSDDPDDPIDWWAEFEQGMKDWFGPTGGQAVSRGLVNALGGIDLSSRVSMRELWWRDTGKDIDERSYAGEVLNQLAGPSIGVGVDVLEGVSMVANGHVERGIERMVPKALRDQMQALRFANEGALTLKGDPLVDELTPFEIMARSAGFTPSRLAARYAENSDTLERETRIEERQKRLTADLAQSRIDAAKAQQSGDTSAYDKANRRFQDALAQVQRFNAKNPAFGIGGKNVVQSVRSRLRARALAQHGIFPNRKIPQRYDYAKDQ